MTLDSPLAHEWVQWRHVTVVDLARSESLDLGPWPPTSGSSNLRVLRPPRSSDLRGSPTRTTSWSELPAARRAHGLVLTVGTTILFPDPGGEPTTPRTPRRPRSRGRSYNPSAVARTGLWCRAYITSDLQKIIPDLQKIIPDLHRRGPGSPEDNPGPP
jgi:hypothetical protein